MMNKINGGVERMTAAKRLKAARRGDPLEQRVRATRKSRDGYGIYMVIQGRESDAEDWGNLTSVMCTDKRDLPVCEAYIARQLMGWRYNCHHMATHQFRLHTEGSLPA